MKGYPVGAAVEFLNSKYAELTSMLQPYLEAIEFGQPYDRVEFVNVWMAATDAQWYTIIGDPAVRLPTLLAKGAKGKRPAIEPVQITTPPDFQAGPVAAGPAEAGGQGAVAGGGGAAVPGAFVISGAITLQPAGAVTAGQPAFATAMPGMADFSFLSRKRPEGEAESAEEQQTRQSLVETIRTMAQKATLAVAKMADEVATLEILTYTSDDLSQVQRTNLDGTAKLRAITSIKLDGDIVACVPQKKDGGVDDALWRVHSDLVQQAQTNRAALIKTVVDAISTLVKV
jgi:hypothetical protein